MDILQQCAKEFEHLIPYQYHIVIGRKGKLLEFTISFEPTDFHHLAGLHKLRDNVRFQTGKRADIMKEIPIYLFLTQRSEKNTHVCRTLFPKTGKDYAKGQPRYTLLKKEKHNLLTGKAVVQYDRFSPINLKREKN